MRKVNRFNFVIGFFVSFCMSQHFSLDIEPTGQYQLIIFEGSISLLDTNDEIGIFDSNGIIQSCYPELGCSEPLIGEVLVGSAVWSNEQISVSSVMSLD